MSTANQELAKRASQIARASDGMRRRAAGCVAMALSGTDDTDAAKAAMSDLWPADLRRAALQLLDDLASCDDAAPLS